MKKIVSLLLCFCMLVSVCTVFVGCGAPKFDQLNGTWQFVAEDNGSYLGVRSEVITIDVENKSVAYTPKNSAEKTNTFGEVKYAKSPLVGSYSKITFNPGKTIGNNYDTQDSYIFIPFGETVMYCKTPYDTYKNKDLPQYGFVRKCTENPEGSLTETTLDFMLDGVVDETNLSVNLDALVGNYTYRSGFESDSEEESASFAKTADGYTHTVRGNVYNVTEAVFHAGYGAVQLTLESVASGYNDITLYVFECTEDHLSVAYWGDIDVHLEGYRYMQKDA